jgi:hypothetical protein
LVVVTLNHDTLIEQALGMMGAEAQGFVPVDGEKLWRFDDHSASCPFRKAA